MGSTSVSTAASFRTMLWIALAAQLSAPQLREVWLENDDTPVNLLAAREFVQVRLRLTVSPTGSVPRCDIEQSSGTRAIDSYTCDLARGRASFQPARSPQGVAQYGMYRIRVIWAARPVDVEPSGDLIARLNPRPRGIRLPALTRVMFAVDKAGRISACSDEPPSLRGMKRNDPALVPIACDQLVKNFRPAPAVDENGQPIESVQNAQVLFVKE